MNQPDSAAGLIAQIAADYPNIPFIALGQTVFWDEPMKAVWRQLLDRNASAGSRLIAGVHDTDYFAKTDALIHSDAPYVMLAHDDAATRGLWSAAGELSALFGSEDLPTRAAYVRNHVPFDLLASEHQGSRSAFASEKTTAWGWRGIVYTGAKQRISGDVQCSEFLPALREQLNWGFDLSISQLGPQQRDHARRIAERIRAWVDEIAKAEGGGSTLSTLYESLLPRFYELLLGYAPSAFETTTSMRLFQFNTATCGLPRFAFVNLFLQPATRGIARAAYDKAVAGGGMYSLDEFADDALPFDVVVPGIGRGTLSVGADAVSVDLPGESRVTDSARLTNVAELAGWLEDRLGTEIALVGKAVSLINMLASEFLIVFHETASGYTDRTTAMNDSIRAAGVPLELNPIVRLQYPTWDALCVLTEQTQFNLPGHLAQSLGKGRISAPEFAGEWRGVAEGQKSKLKQLSSVRSPRELLGYLENSGDESQCWRCLLQKYEEAQSALSARANELSRLAGYVAVLKSERHAMRTRMDELQRRKGEHFRASIAPLQEEIAGLSDVAPVTDLKLKLAEQESARKSLFTVPLEEMRLQARHWDRTIRHLRGEMRRVERSGKARRQRDLAHQITLQAEGARLEHVHAALITSVALPHTQARPSAWWIPMVDPSGQWLAAISQGTTARLERL